jgi:hypothetical protein
MIVIYLDECLTIGADKSIKEVIEEMKKMMSFHIMIDEEDRIE